MDFITWRTPHRQPRQAVKMNHVPWGIEVHHTVTEAADTPEELIERCRAIYDYHVKTLGWWDSWYNFLIGRDGSIAVGRGWEHASYADDGGPDSQVDRLTVVLVGNYQHDEPTEAQRTALHALEAELVERGGGTDHSYHRVRSKTACPGDNVVNQWHWLWAKPAPKTEPKTEPKNDEGDIVSQLPTLRRGNEGQAVRNLQGLLAAHAPDLTLQIDGIFGPKTESVLATWQERTNYLHKHERGYCGRRTWRWFLGVPQ